MYLPTDHTVLRGHKLIKPWMVLSDACDPRFYTSSFTIQSLYMREFLEVETVLVMLTTYPSLPFKNLSMKHYLQHPITCWDKTSLPYNSQNARKYKIKSTPSVYFCPLKMSSKYSSSCLLTVR